MAEAHEMLKTYFGNITMGRTWIFTGFLDSNVDKTAKDRERGGRSSIVSGDEKLQTVRKIVKDERRKHHFGNHRQVWPLVWNMSGDSKGGLIHVDGSPLTLCLASPPTSKKQQKFLAATWFWSPTLLTRQIWPLVISSCFQE